MRVVGSLMAFATACCIGGIATADVTGHNGTVATGGTGAVQVAFSETHNTEFHVTLGTDVHVSGTSFTKTFNEIRRHELAYSYAEVYFGIDFALPFPPTHMEPNVGDGMLVRETITNDDAAGKLWGGYRFGLESADVYTDCSGFCEFPAELGVVSLFDLQNDGSTRNVEVSDIGFSTSAALGTVGISVTQDIAAGAGPIVELTFQNPLGVNGSFNLEYLVNFLSLPTGIVSSGFLLFQEPIEYNPIPAPGAAVLAAMGLGMVGWIRRRRI